jgi:hypothetical protein
MDAHILYEWNFNRYMWLCQIFFPPSLVLCVRLVNYLTGLGASLVVNSSWKNPTGEWRVGYKLVYELFMDTQASG